MSFFEKALFIELTNHFTGKGMYDPDFIEVYNHLNKNEKTEYSRLSSEIKQARDYIVSSSFLFDEQRPKINSVFEYSQTIKKVDPTILKMCQDFTITLGESDTTLSDKQIREMRDKLGL